LLLQHDTFGGRNKREAVKRKRVTPTARLAFFIQALILNYGSAAKNVLPREVSWGKAAS
jgi:hypothetical protein